MLKGFRGWFDGFVGGLNPITFCRFDDGHSLVTFPMAIPPIGYLVREKRKEIEGEEREGRGERGSCFLSSA